MGGLRCLLLLLLFQCSVAAPLPSPSLAGVAARRRIPAVIVFGDSTVDAGNNNYVATAAKADFPPYGRDFPGGRATGRFCNGRLATDFISEALGLPPSIPAYLDPQYTIEDFARGVCFASAGTGFDTATSDILSVIPLWKEVEFFKEYRRRLTAYVGKTKAAYIVSEAVYIVSIGTNDFIENYYTPVGLRRWEFTVEEYTDFIVGLACDFFRDIYRVGARKISFAGLSPFGCLPSERTMNPKTRGECVEEYNRVAQDFNGKLQAAMRRLCGELPGIKLRFVPLYDLFLDATRNPSRYGFESASRGCCGTGKFETSIACNKWTPFTCEDADKFAFWDSIHPSERFNKFFANQTLRTSIAEFI